jgi:hypothetical protein
MMSRPQLHLTNVRIVLYRLAVLILSILVQTVKTSFNSRSPSDNGQSHSSSNTFVHRFCSSLLAGTRYQVSSNFDKYIADAAVAIKDLASKLHAYDSTTRVHGSLFKPRVCWNVLILMQL